MDRFVKEIETTAREAIRWGVARNVGLLVVYFCVGVSALPALADLIFNQPLHALYGIRVGYILLLWRAAYAAAELAQITIAPRLYLMNEAGDFVLALRKAGIDADIAERVARVL